MRFADWIVRNARLISQHKKTTIAKDRKWPKSGRPFITVKFRRAGSTATAANRAGAYSSTAKIHAKFANAANPKASTTVPSALSTRARLCRPSSHWRPRRAGRWKSCADKKYVERLRKKRRASPDGEAPWFIYDVLTVIFFPALASSSQGISMLRTPFLNFASTFS